ncbi:hypothetical protein [Stenotrophomonas maltophilia]|uniref:hypothetical protein n=1 Tax=Stenotrophomonas maltophilia TaxID=40324 RepID=UPI0034D776BD
MADPLYCPWALGSPCLKPEVWAAWAQALLSALAIYAAARIAAKQERLAFRRKADACIGLMSHTEQTLFMALENPNSDETKMLVGTVLEQLRSVPMEAVPDLRLMTIINRASRRLARLHSELIAAPSPSAVIAAANILGRRRLIAAMVNEISMDTLEMAHLLDSIAGRSLLDRVKAWLPRNRFRHAAVPDE